MWVWHRIEGMARDANGLPTVQEASDRVVECGLLAALAAVSMSWAGAVIGAAWERRSRGSCPTPLGRLMAGLAVAAALTWLAWRSGEFFEPAGRWVGAAAVAGITLAACCGAFLLGAELPDPPQRNSASEENRP